MVIENNIVKKKNVFIYVKLKKEEELNKIIVKKFVFLFI